MTHSFGYLSSAAPTTAIQTHADKLQQVRVPHLGGIDAAYQMPRPYDASKPTLVLVNSLTTSSELFRPQYADEKLNQAMNLIAIEPLGHGQTKTKRETWTIWDIGSIHPSELAEDS